MAKEILITVDSLLAERIADGKNAAGHRILAEMSHFAVCEPGLIHPVIVFPP